MLAIDLIPAAEPNSRRLMVLLHGLGDSMEGYRWLPAALNLPWLNYLLVNAPDEYYDGFSWFDISGDRGAARGAATISSSNCSTRSAPPVFPRSRRCYLVFPKAV